MHFWPALACLVVSLVAPRWWVPALRRWGVVDMPNERSSHRLPTIRGAGLAPASGVLAGLLVGVMLTGTETGLLLCVLLGAPLALAVLGLAEDVRGVPIVVRAAGQLGVGLALAAALCVVLDRSLGWLLPVALAVAGYVNVANFMDGVNGMSALHGFVAGSYFPSGRAGARPGVDFDCRRRHSRCLHRFRTLESSEGPGLPRRRRQLRPRGARRGLWSRRVPGRGRRCSRSPPGCLTWLTPV